MKDLLTLIFLLAIVIVPPYGYFHNMYLFAKLDFKEPYKAEILRGAGIFVPPLGVVEGWIDIQDGNQ